MCYGKAVSFVEALLEEGFTCALEGKLQIYPPLQLLFLFPPVSV